MLTTAGSTRFTSGAKLCCGNNPAAGGGASLEAGGFCAHNGDSASVAPRPKPRAAARVFLNQGWPGGPAGSSVMMSDLPIARMTEATWDLQGDRSLSGGLIRRNLAMTLTASL